MALVEQIARESKERREQVACTTTTTLDMSASLPVLRTTPWPTTRPAAYRKAFGRCSRPRLERGSIPPQSASRTY